MSRTAFPRGQRLDARKDVAELRAVERAIRDRLVHRWKLETDPADGEDETARDARIRRERQNARLLRRRLTYTAEKLGHQLRTAIVYEDGRWVVVYEVVTATASAKTVTE